MLYSQARLTNLCFLDLAFFIVDTGSMLLANSEHQAEGSISSGSAVIAKIENSFRERNTLYYRNFD